MTKADAVKAILQRWMIEWPSLSDGTPYVFDNDVADESSTYARVRIQSLQGGERTIGAPGNRRFVREGLIIVELRGPANHGRGPLDVLAAHVRTIFEAVRIGPAGEVVTFSSYDSEDTSDAARWVLAVSTPFEYDEPR